jgi:hypothetical protein
MNYISFHTLNARSTHLLYFLVCFTNFWPNNKHVFILEIDIQIPRHIFIIWCMRRRFSAVLCNIGFQMIRSKAIEANRMKSCVFCEWPNQSGYFSVVKIWNLKYTHNFSFVYMQSQNINLPNVTITRYLQIENIRLTYRELTRLCLFHL